MNTGDDRPPASQPGRQNAGTGYVVAPAGGVGGPGVLVLHGWWGLTPVFKDVCDRLADAGFVALAPDLCEGRTTNDPDVAHAMLADADMDATLHLVRAAAMTLHTMPATPDGRIGVVGFSMGASWALWLAARLPEVIGATVAFYGTQAIDMAATDAPILGHFGEDDEVEAADNVALLEADLKLLDKDVTFHRYPNAGHWFFEADRPVYAPEAAELAWERTLAFLKEHL